MQHTTKALTPEQFKAVAKDRGYTLAAISRLWGFTPARLSQIAADPNRPACFDFALWGLPPKSQYNAVAARRLAAAHASANKLPKRRLGRLRDAGRTPFDHDAYWRDVTAPGSIFIVQYEQGDHLPQGARGHVITTIKRGNKELVRIRFPTGYEEEFDQVYLRSKECFLWATGQRIDSKPAELSSTGKESV